MPSTDVNTFAYATPKPSHMTIRPLLLPALLTATASPAAGPSKSIAMPDFTKGDTVPAEAVVQRIVVKAHRAIDLVNHRGEQIDVGVQADAAPIPRRLLGREVARRAHDLADVGRLW